MNIHLLSADRLSELLRKKRKTDVPFLDKDDFDWLHEESTRGHYWVAEEHGKIVAVFKFFLWPKNKEHLNQWLSEQGWPLVTGKVYNGAYIGVHPKYRRKGVATALNNAVLGMLAPGDVFVLGTHEPDGKLLNRAWLAENKGKVNIMYGPRYTAYADYDPTRPNYMVSDTDDFGRVASRVAQRFLEAGTIDVPKKLLKEVQDWAVSNWAVTSYEEAENRYRIAINDVERAETRMEEATRFFRELFRLLDRGNLDAAARMYRTYSERDNFNNATYWSPELSNSFTKPEEFYFLDPGVLRGNLETFFAAYVRAWKKNLAEDEPGVAKNFHDLQKLDALRGDRTQVWGRRQFTLVGDEFRYPSLKGKRMAFNAVYTVIMSRGSWNPDTKTLAIANYDIDSVDTLKMIVHHELQHAVQTFLAMSLGRPENLIHRDVGVGPRNTRTPEYTQHGDANALGVDPEYLHDLDDIEFHTELEGARKALTELLGKWPKSGHTPLFRGFIKHNKFLAALRSTPKAAAKYRVALKELSKLVT